MAPTWGCAAAASILSASSAMQAHAASRLSVLLERACLPQNATTYTSPQKSPSVLHPPDPCKHPLVAVHLLWHSQEDSTLLHLVDVLRHTSTARGAHGLLPCGLQTMHIAICCSCWLVYIWMRGLTGISMDWLQDCAIVNAPSTCEYARRPSVATWRLKHIGGSSTGSTSSLKGRAACRNARTASLAAYCTWNQ